MRLSSASLLVAAASVIAITLWGWGCGGTNNGDNGFPNSSSGSGGSNGSSGAGSSSGTGGSSGVGGSSGIFGDAGAMPMDSGGTGCTNLQCNVHSCSNGGSTTISGKVMDPAGHNPIYNVVVYIPNSQGGALDLIPTGIGPDSCSCDLFSGEPMADAITAPDGTFTIKNAPDGANIPLVVQIGKWRKEITINNVAMCQDNPQGNINLPKSHTDGMFASIPNIAVSTGGADTLECLLTRVGVDESEFSGDPNTGSARVHVFQGSGGNSAAGSPSSPTSLWDSEADLERYDIVLLSCEGAPTAGASAATAPQVANYINKGGRLFGEHYHYAFFTDYTNTQGVAFPQFANVANWDNVGLGANDSPYTNDITGIIETTLPNGKMFPEGAALKTWLGNVGALNASQEIVVPVLNARDNAIVTASNIGTPWVQTDPSISPASTQYLSWDMPLMPPVNDAGVPQYCGRVVYSDMHVSGSAADYQTGNTTVPTGCDSGKTLSPDEDAIEFILFDLSSCIVPVGYPPKPPPPDGGGIQ
jgi:hypothetical protein